MNKEALRKALDAKGVSATRGHKQAGDAFVTFDGATVNLNALSEYVHSLERAIRAVLAEAKE